MVQVITTDGKILQGYERTNGASPESSNLIIEDPATGKLTTISKQEIEEKRVTGSPMPTGLTALLSEDQLLDLLQYLTELNALSTVITGRSGNLGSIVWMEISPTRASAV